MKSSHFVFLILAFLFIATACDKEDVTPEPCCTKEVEINPNDYQSAPTDGITIIDIHIDGDCLVVQYGASGCSGDSWDLRLIDSGVVLESDPVQRNLILSLENDEACNAYFTKEVTFDLTALQTGGGEIQLNITNTDHEILYSYLTTL